MVVLDSSGWIEVVTEGVNAKIFSPCVENANELLMPTIVVYEVLRYLDVFGSEELVKHALSSMSLASIVPLTEAIAHESVKTARTYKLPMADSIILTTAKRLNATLWTQDKHFKDIDGVKYFQKS